MMLLFAAAIFLILLKLKQRKALFFLLATGSILINVFGDSFPSCPPNSLDVTCP